MPVAHKIITVRRGLFVVLNSEFWRPRKTRVERSYNIDPIWWQLSKNAPKIPSTSTFFLAFGKRASRANIRRSIGLPFAGKFFDFYQKYNNMYNRLCRIFAHPICWSASPFSKIYIDVFHDFPTRGNSNYYTDRIRIKLLEDDQLEWIWKKGLK